MTGVTVRCPGCGHRLPVELIFEPGGRRADGDWVVEVRPHPELEERLRAHAALHPELHREGFTQVG